MTMLTGLLRVEEVDANLAINIITCHVRRKQVHRKPCVHIIGYRLDLRLVNRLPCLAIDELVDQEEVEASHLREGCLSNHLDFFFGTKLLLLSCDLDDTILILTTLIIHKWLGHDTIT